MTVNGPTTDRRAEEPVPGLAPTLRIATIATVVFALLGLLPGAFHTAAATVAVVLVVAAPVVRVLWLSIRWGIDGDLRFSLAAAGLLVVLLGGATLAAITS
jgi:hypothetical protein